MGLPWDDPDADPLADIRALHDANPPRSGAPLPPGKPLPPERLVPLAAYLCWQAWAWITWPWQKRQLKKQGWREIDGGWMEMP